MSLSDWLSNLEKKIEENIDAVATIILISVILVLDHFSILSISSIDGGLIIGIFTIIVSSIGTLVTLILVMDRILEASYSIALADQIKKVFMLPFKFAVLGLMVSLVNSSISVSLTLPEKILGLTPKEIYNLAILAILFYTVFALYLAFEFMIDIKFRDAKENR